MNYQLPPHLFVNTARKWNECLRELQSVSRFAVDLESNGLFAYREQICLIQISTENRDFIVDPFAEIDLAPFGELIGDAVIEKVFHASEYDLILMKRERDWEIEGLFDTMWAARVLGYEKIGLASMLGELYGLEISKKHQRANWSERPLTRDQLAYAQTDTHFLLQMRDELEERLEAMGRLEEAEEIFMEQSHVRLPDVAFSADSFWSINGTRDLDPRQKAVLRELNIYRDQEARERNRPPFKVFANRTLIELAERMPRRTNELSRVYGLRERQVRRYGRGLLAAIERGKQAPIPKRAKRERKPDDVVERYEALHEWRKNRARERGIASDVVMTRETMWDLAYANPSSAEMLSAVESFGTVRRGLYGAEVLAVLQNLA